ncbi:glycosyltransferase family 4 protein [Candidatus Beckwithbacteria bacterium]|nr:glycosyltransferase family 4 protein [Candidatus Beckwithbacteria bacterium]
MAKPKIAIIFPEYNPDGHTHFPYWYKVFALASKKLDLFILFESGKKQAKIANAKSKIQNWQNKPINLLERLYYLVSLRLQGYKVFYVHYSLFGFLLARLVTWILGGKVYLWDCEYYSQKPSNVFLIWAIKTCDSLVTGHEKIAKQYRKILELKNKDIKIVPNWVEEKPETKKLQTNKLRNILFVHHLSPRKGSRLLPEIINKVLAQSKKTKFTIVGDGPDKAWLKQKLAPYIENGQVIIKGNLPRSQVNHEFEKADLLIMPSLSEGFPRVILEAQSFGLPYVAFDVGCVAEISPMAESKYIIDNKNIKLFYQKIINFLDNQKKETQKLEPILKKQSKQYSLKLAVKNFVNIFKD